MRKSILLAILVSGCATSQAHKDEVANEAMARCASLGYVAQSPEWRQCAQNLYFATLQAEAARRQQASRDFAAAAAILANQPPAPAPTPTVLCRQSYAGVYCQ